MRLACADYGGTGAPVVLLYGLCGHAGEWAETASGLSTSRRVVIPEQRGHGRSDRQPADMSRAAFVRSRLVEIANAGHDIHLDQPERWRQALETFISVEFCQ